MTYCSYSSSSQQLPNTPDAGTTAADTRKMVAETPAPAQEGAIVAVGQVKSASGSGVNQADIEQVKKLLTQTKAIGVILPPPDIRAIVDKTAQFVAKNGACVL